MAFTKKEVPSNENDTKVVIKKEVEEACFYDMKINAASPHTQGRIGYLYAHPHRLTFNPGELLEQVPACFKSVLEMNVVKIQSLGKDKNGNMSRIGKTNDKTDYTFTILRSYDKDRKEIK